MSGTEPSMDGNGRRIGLRTIIALLLGGVVGWVVVGLVWSTVFDSDDDAGSSSQSLTSSSPISIPSGWTTYTNELSGFSISYPSDWVVVSLNETALEALEGMGQEALETDAKAVPPALSVGLPLEDGRIAPNVQIIFARIPDTASAAEMVAVTQEAMAQVFPTYARTKEIITGVGGREVGIVHGSYAMSDVSEILGAVVEGRWWVVQLVLPIDGVGWQVTCGTLGATAEDAEEDIATCESVVRTLEIG